MRRHFALGLVGFACAGILFLLTRLVATDRDTPASAVAASPTASKGRTEPSTEQPASLLAQNARLKAENVRLKDASRQRTDQRPFLGERQASRDGKVQRLVVTRGLISKNQSISESDLHLLSIPNGLVPAEPFRTLNRAVGRVTRRKIPHGSILQSEMLYPREIIQRTGKQEVDIGLEAPFRQFDVRIHRVLLGREAVEHGVLYDTQFVNSQKQGKYIVYFQVSVKNLTRRRAHRVSQRDFRLEDNEGNLHEVFQTLDYVTGKIHQGRTARGGIAFSVYSDNMPARLFYDTGFKYTATGEPAFASVTIDSLFTMRD